MRASGDVLATSCAATCAPLNPAYRASEFDFYLADLRASAVLVQHAVESPVRDVARARGIPVIEVLPCLKAEAGGFRLLGSSSKRCAAWRRRSACQLSSRMG